MKDEKLNKDKVQEQLDASNQKIEDCELIILEKSVISL